MTSPNDKNEPDDDAGEVAEAPQAGDAPTAEVPAGEAPTEADAPGPAAKARPSSRSGGTRSSKASASKAGGGRAAGAKGAAGSAPTRSSATKATASRAAAAGAGAKAKTSPSPRLSKEARDEEAAEAKGRSRMAKTVWIFVGLGLVLGIAAGVAIFATRSDEPIGATQIGVQGDELPPLAAGSSDTAAGQRIPTIQGKALDGTNMTIAADGRPKVIIFLAHWCPHCQAEVPRLQEWIDARGVPPDVELRAVATASDSARPNFPADAWLEEEGWTVLTMLDNAANSAAKAYGVSGFPFFVVVDADGNVVTRESGEITTQRWEQLLESARTGTAAQGPAPSAPASPNPA